MKPELKNEPWSISTTRNTTDVHRSKDGSNEFSDLQGLGFCRDRTMTTFSTLASTGSAEGSSSPRFPPMLPYQPRRFPDFLIGCNVEEVGDSWIHEGWGVESLACRQEEWCEMICDLITCFRQSGYQTIGSRVRGQGGRTKGAR